MSDIKPIVDSSTLSVVATTTPIIELGDVWVVTADVTGANLNPKCS